MMMMVFSVGTVRTQQNRFWFIMIIIIMYIIICALRPDDSIAETVGGRRHTVSERLPCSSLFSVSFPTVP